MSELVPFWVCDYCGEQADESDNASAINARSNTHVPYTHWYTQSCHGKLQPVIFVSDLKKILQERLEEYKKGKTIASRFYPGDELNSCEINELESILSEIDGGGK